MTLIDKDDLYDRMMSEMVGTGYQSRALNVINMATEIKPQPNPPLTLEELLKMHKDPVWYQLKDGQKGCGLVSIEKSDQTVFIAGLNGFLIAVYICGDYNNRLGAKLYRRKPEEEK